MRRAIIMKDRYKGSMMRLMFTSKQRRQESAFCRLPDMLGLPAGGNIQKCWFFWQKSGPGKAFFSSGHPLGPDFWNFRRLSVTYCQIERYTDDGSLRFQKSYNSVSLYRLFGGHKAFLYLSERLYDPVITPISSGQKGTLTRSERLSDDQRSVFRLRNHRFLVVSVLSFLWNEWFCWQTFVNNISIMICRDSLSRLFYLLCKRAVSLLKISQI